MLTSLQLERALWEVASACGHALIDRRLGVSAITAEDAVAARIDDLLVELDVP